MPSLRTAASHRLGYDIAAALEDPGG